MSQHRITWSRQAARAVAQQLPESAAVACVEFILGPLAENPRRVGKPLRAPLEDLHSARRGDYRVIYRIDQDARWVHIVAVRHRRDAYRG